MIHCIAEESQITECSGLQIRRAASNEPDVTNNIQREKPVELVGVSGSQTKA